MPRTQKCINVVIKIHEVCGGHLYPGSCGEYTGHLILAAEG